MTGRDAPESAGPRAAPAPAPSRGTASEGSGWAGIVGETPAGPAIPGTAAAPPPRRAVVLVSFSGAAPASPSAARAWEMRSASMVVSCRISARLQARSASSHSVVRWPGWVPVASASAMTAPLGARRPPPRYRSQDVLL
ncbi:hypothetical protein GCM10017687_71860 [Streptomyces echinatus]|uniref:hypothetical protein n=1 Tax=Streptomyces echinatus TaxID=67293 RepID=UPI0031F17AE7